jgi:hypothetical protein
VNVPNGVKNFPSVRVAVVDRVTAGTMNTANAARRDHSAVPTCPAAET